MPLWSWNTSAFWLPTEAHLVRINITLDVFCMLALTVTLFNVLRHVSVMLFISGAALEKIFEPLTPVQEDVQYSAYVCHRHSHCPRLHIRRARFTNTSHSLLDWWISWKWRRTWLGHISLHCDILFIRIKHIKSILI